ncbi:glycosyltransferase [Marinobacter qingdaonensis]|uniref:Glycosyltransferase n=1 Tax=Marinobacter qingdaonensis TaxID=3108486 RepID=A0ABU5P0A4_9GAMM|nr:glycosyltransferase [Marinobacter sp. ASW11-75]MEA1081417.1 glycosyltransferase [Marinobacter sp. ASW11-75]
MPARESESKPRLLVLASTYPRWPDDHEPNFVHRLCVELSEDYEVTVVTARSPGSEKKEWLGPVCVQRFSYAPEKFQTLVYGGGILTNLKRNPLKWLLVPLFVFSMCVAALSAIRKVRPIAIHCHWIIPQGLVLWLLSRISPLPPVLVTSHGADLFALRGPIGTWLKRKVLERADAVTVASSPMKPIATGLGAKEESIHVAPMGIGFESNFRLPSRKRVPGQILFVGRLVEKKGLKYLIEALPRILLHQSDCELIIVGDGPERINLEEQTHRLGLSESVRFVGALPQKKLPQYYQSASLFCAPFIEAENGDVEGLGLVTIEAMSFRCPILIGNVAATQDVVPPQFRSLCLVNPKDTTIFAEQVVQRLSLSEAATDEIDALKEYAIEQFSWSNVKNRYLGIFEKLRA